MLRRSQIFLLGACELDFMFAVFVSKHFCTICIVANIITVMLIKLDFMHISIKNIFLSKRIY